jgi:hypothetical protein
MAQDSRAEPVSPIGPFSENSREHAGISAKTLGLVVGRSRVFPAVPGIWDRKGTAGEALRSGLRSIVVAQCLSRSAPMRRGGQRAMTCRSQLVLLPSRHPKRGGKESGMATRSLSALTADDEPTVRIQEREDSEGLFSLSRTRSATSCDKVMQGRSHGGPRWTCCRADPLAT